MPRIDEDIPPTTVGEYIRPRFGVEIEFSDRELVVGSDEITRRLTEAGLETRNERYNKTVHSFWKLTTDGTCGLELVSPPMHFEDRWAIGIAMQIIYEAGGRVTRDCGFHVHHEWPWQLAMANDYTRYQVERNARLTQLLWAYDKYLPLIGVLIPRNRLTIETEEANRYAGSNKGKRLSASMQDEDGRGRYVAVNLMPLADGRNTVEFRQHQGTLNLSKAIAWLEFTRQLTAAATNEFVAINIDDDYPGWCAAMEAKVPVVMEKLSGSALRYIIQRCSDKNTTLETVLALVADQIPDDPRSYGTEEVRVSHAEAITKTLGSAQFEPSDH